MTYRLDGALMTSPEALHDQLAETFDFPDYYGRNLDALWDLWTSLPRPFTIHLRNPGLAEIQLGQAWMPFFQTLKDLEACEGVDVVISGVGSGEIDPSPSTW